MRNSLADFHFHLTNMMHSHFSICPVPLLTVELTVEFILKLPTKLRT